MVHFLKDYNVLFFVLSIIFLAIAIAEALIFYSWRKKSKYEVQMMIFKDKTLIRQINVHFIFNFLNSLQSHLISDQKIEAMKHLGKFSNVLRRFIENSMQTQITIQKELEALKLYMEIEKFRFRNAFDIEINVHPEINIYQYKMPSFLLQPFVENALYHGVLYLEKQSNKIGKISISLQMKKNEIEIVVEDNGVGRVKAQEIEAGRGKKSFGNQFIQKRLETLSKIYKKNFSVQFIDKYDEDNNALGTKVLIVIPKII